MVIIPPYAPSLQWYGEWFRSRSSGFTEEEAIALANRSCRISGKDYARALLGTGSSMMLLSVALEGGASRLKNRGIEKKIRVSGHGNWPHVHLGALEALYGRSPYYQHIIPGIRELLSDMPETLSELNNRVHSYLSDFFQPERKLMITDAHRERGAEIRGTLNQDLSVIDALMRYGPETNLIFIS